MAKKYAGEEIKHKRKPAITPEARENQMISLAMDLVEKRLREGTASSQETTHFLKLATVKEQLEREKIQEDIHLLKAKKNAIEANERTEKLFADAIEAMKNYSPSIDQDSDEVYVNASDIQ